ncbi:MAG: hypothetical protein ACYS1A_13650 [Planctomycetota bacterium]|jgi:preprotein translocase subunit SecG
MLDFLREQQLKDPSEQKQTDAVDETGADVGATEQAQEQEYFTVAGKDENVRRSTILLAVLFGIGLLCLWYMIKKSTPQKAAAVAVSTEETQIEAAIARLGGVKSEMFNRMDEIVKKFYELSDVHQVQTNELVKNPFKHDLYFGSATDFADAEESKFDSEQQLRETARNMQLFSIMRSEQGNCCMIDDKILYEGNTIRGFNVGQIGDNFVRLETEDMKIILKLLE